MASYSPLGRHELAPDAGGNSKSRNSPKGMVLTYLIIFRNTSKSKKQDFNRINNHTNGKKNYFLCFILVNIG